MSQEQTSPSCKHTLQFEQKDLLFHDPPFHIPVDAMSASGFGRAYTQEPFITPEPRYILVDEKSGHRLLPASRSVASEAQAQAWIAHIIDLVSPQRPSQGPLFEGVGSEDIQEIVRQAYKQAIGNAAPTSPAPRKYWYKDFQHPGKLRWTRARFIGWTQPIGVLHVPHAVFQRPSGEHLLIPDYLLTDETRALLPAPPTEDADREAKHGIRNIPKSGAIRDRH
jgi:hypothetical protein